ncbi:hypothetical protein PybrP1_008498 [[Pythium] brassicae (nom. inval.)]|nr:hypothetical protein PybrP1_008498 [[Pythium] brassicae (nom. inval.)]
MSWWRRPFASTPKRQYTAQRLFALRDYCESASQRRMLRELLLFCSPSLVLAITLDLIPLHDPKDGWRANGGYWMRVFVGATVVVSTLLVRAQALIPELAFTRTQLATITAITASAYTATLLVLAAWWRFPIPFMYTLSSVPMILSLNACVVATIGTADKARLCKYVRFSCGLGVQAAMLVVYPTYNALFKSLEGTSQLALVLLLPAIKYAFKYLTTKAHFAAEELLTAELTSVDFFDALYMTKCMQSGTTLLVGVAIIVADTAQNVAAILNLARQTRALARVRASSQRPSHANNHSDGQQQVFAAGATRTELIPWVLALLQQLTLSASRAFRPSAIINLSSASLARELQKGSLSSTKGPATTVVAAARPPPTNAVIPAPPAFSDQTAQDKAAVAETLRLLHVSESVILVEYIETVVPVMYAIYTAVLFHLPGAAYHPDMHALSNEQFRSAVLNILAYAGMELLSMVSVHYALKRYFGLSVLHQLGFALKRDRPIILSSQLSWSLIIFQFLLVHNGADFTRLTSRLPARERPSKEMLRRSAVRVAKAPVGVRVFCAAPKNRAVSSAEIPLHIGVTAGGIAGVISALTGVGGGLILIPVRVLQLLRVLLATTREYNQTLARFTSLPQQAVNGTSIGAVTLSASVGAWNHLESGACNYPLALATTMPGIICTRYGVQAAQRLSSKRLSLVVGAAMLACAPLIFLKNSAHFPKWSAHADPLDLQFYGHPAAAGGAPLSADTSYTERVQRDLPGFAAANAKYLGAGALAGFISGLCGLGGGILITAYLTATSDMPQETIIGTSLLSIVPTAAASTVHNVRAKAIHLPTAARVGGALAVGVYATSKYATHDVPEDVLRGILGTTLGTAALVMMRRAL